MRTSTRTAAGALMLALLATTAPVAQGQQPVNQTPQATFRSSTRLVVHSVTVTDRNGQPVRGLTPKDFVVRENNQVQEVAFAVFQEIPTEAAPLPPADPAAVAVAPALPPGPAVVMT